MKKRLIMTIFVTIILAVLVACGSNDIDTKNNEEVVQGEAQVSPMPEYPSEEGVVNTEINEENSIETENENREIVETESNVPIWYMDSDGMKNEELGVIIRKNPDILLRLEWTIPIEIVSSKDTGGTSSVGSTVTCAFYEGDTDTYIKEQLVNCEKEEGKVGDIDCIYYGINGGVKDHVLFIKDGVAISLGLYPDEKNIDDYLNEIGLIKADNESSGDCLAYFTDDGLYCPAIGIKLTYEKNKTRIEGFLVNLTYSKSYSHLTIGKGLYRSNAENAQKKLDEYVKTKIEPVYEWVEYTPDEEVLELNIGQCKYFGRSVIGQVEGDSKKDREWLFCSDESSWSISLTHNEDDEYEDFISSLEKLE